MQHNLFSIARRILSIPLHQDDLIICLECMPHCWVILNLNALLNLNNCISIGKTRCLTYSHFPSFSIYNGLFDLKFNSAVQIYTKSHLKSSFKIYSSTYNVNVISLILLIFQKFTNFNNHLKVIDSKLINFQVDEILTVTLHRGQDLTVKLW